MYEIELNINVLEELVFQCEKLPFKCVTQYTGIIARCLFVFKELLWYEFVANSRSNFDNTFRTVCLTFRIYTDIFGPNNKEFNSLNVILII